MMNRGTRSLRGCLVVVFVFFVALTGSAPARGAVSSSLFTPEEWRRLDAGKLVVRASTRTRGSLHLMGGASWQVIDAAPDAVWRALLDTPRYHRMMPQVIKARLLRQEDGTRSVFLRQGQKGLVEADYVLKVNVHEERRDITFAVDDSYPHELVKAAWGFYAVRPYRDGKTLLAYSVMADVGSGPLIGLMRGTMHEWMLKTPSMVKQFVEGSGRRRYS